MPGLRRLALWTREVRLAGRTLRKSPLFTLTTVLTLAICIGANTALFSVVDAVLLRPLPYPEPERLGEVITRYQDKGAELDEDAQRGQTWFLLRDHGKSFDAAVSSGLVSGVNFAANGRVEYVQQERVGAGFFRVLGIPPLVGREFSAEEDAPGSRAAVVLLSHRLWQRVFQADPTVAGRVVMLRGEPHEIVGVMPPELVTTGTADLWTPLQPSTTGEGEGENYRVIVRLRPGAAWSQAAGEISMIGETALAERRAEDPSIRLALVPLQRGLTATVRKPLLVLWAAAGMLLLIGCVNIASLLLARAVGLGLPYERHLRMGFQFMDGPEAAGPGGNTTATYVTPDYFTVLRIPLVRGRQLRESDGPDTQRVTVVNEAFVRRYLPAGDPIGRRIQTASETREIVGVVGDILQQSGGENGPIAALPATFFPAAQASDEMVQLVHMWFSPSWIVRTAGPPERAAADLQRAIEAVDPQMPVASFRGMEQIEHRATARQRFQAILLATLAGPALLLAALGIYGLIAHSVAERRREVGIRLALGATRWQTMCAVALPGILLSLVGVLAGCLLARLAVKSLQHLIWGVRAADPGTFVAVAAGLLLVAVVASLLPTLRLARIDPALTLRDP